MAAEVMRQPGGMEMVVALLRYLSRAGIKVDKEEVVEKLVERVANTGSQVAHCFRLDHFVQHESDLC